MMSPAKSFLSNVSLAIGLLGAACASPVDKQPSRSSDDALSASASASIASDAQLASVLDALSDVASGGASLAYFSWRENPDVPANGCHDATANDVAAAFDEIVDGVMLGGDPTEAPQLTSEVIAEAKIHFRALVGQGDYKVCHESTSGFMAAGHITTFVGETGGVRVALETGWED